MPRADPPLLGVGRDVAAPAAKSGLVSAFQEIGTSSRRLRERGCPCTRWDAAAGMAGVLAGCGLVLGLVYVLYPQGFACQTEEHARYSSGMAAALQTLVACAPMWCRVTVLVGVGLRSWPASPISAAFSGRVRGARIAVKRSLLDRQHSGWTSIVSGESTWSQACESLRLAQPAAIRTAFTNLLLWHWSQPVSYYVVLEAYKCYPRFMDYDSIGMDPPACFAAMLACLSNAKPYHYGYEGLLAVVVAGREVLYIFSTVLALLICPAFLLLDPVTTWNEARGVGQVILRLGCYLLAPHSFVVLCITNRYRTWQRSFVTIVVVHVVADFASCLLLGSLILDKIWAGDDVPSALLVGYASTAFGFVLCFGPYVCYHNLQLACSCSTRTHKCHRAGHGILGGLVMLGLCYLWAGVALLIAKIDIVCLGYTGHFFDDLPECSHPHDGPYLGLIATIQNNSTKTLFLIGDQKTTISAYRTDMAKFGASNHPFVAIKPGSSVVFRSTGNFMSESKNAGVTFWVATNCDEYGKCSWNEDRTEGAVLEWNMFQNTLYYDISAVEAMDSFRTPELRL